ncbi:MAG: MBL fold metallo-hydrolase [Desulfurococcales archaeon]|nr:MBL fold metallo-hydrolase [Desulfurococcales archaeon]
MDCSVSIVKGSPATLIEACSDKVYVVDPGHGRKRARQLAKTIKSRGPRETVFLVTHYHSDHHIALSQGLLEAEGLVGAVVAAPRLDSPALRDPLLRVTLTFGYPLPPSSSLTLFDPLPVRVDVELEPPARLGPLEVLPLPGHTPGQVGVVAGDGTLYAADSLFGLKVLERYGAPYHFDPCQALETLEGLLDSLGRYERLQPSHGPLVAGGDAFRLVEANIEAVKGLLEGLKGVLREPASLEEASMRLAPALRVPPEPPVLLLFQATLRGALSCLHARGEVEVLQGGYRVRWRAARR